MAVETGTSSEKAEKKEIALYILTSNEKGFIPCIPDSINYELNEYGAPGKLTFKVMKDKILDFEEGACVQFSYGDKKLFRGYVFSRKQDKNGIVSVTAYDQLRYLKNKDIYAFAGVTASQILKQIADDFKLQLGDVDDTKYVIPKMRASNETLFDIIQKALDHTYLFSKNESGEFEKKRYILFDDFGKICLKEVGALDVPILVDSETAENFSFESSIDKDTYNKVKLYEDNKDTGKREVYIAEDSANQARWGILQMTESVNTQRTMNPEQKAKIMLDSHNFAKKNLTISHAFGDCRVRAGSRIYVSLNVKDSATDLGCGKSVVQMLVKQVKHTFTNDYYTMDLTLKGGALGEQAANGSTAAAGN